MVNSKIFNRPRVVVSKCLNFDQCRYDGQMISNSLILYLKDYVDFEVVCPEVEIGMGTPRDPIRIEQNGDKTLLVQPKTGKEFSSQMSKFSEEFCLKINRVDGFILKHASPSCGISSAKTYSSKSPASIGKQSGLFASNVEKYFPLHPKEDEKRLNNVYIREHYLSSIFTLADFRSVSSIDGLYNFHAKHKYLLMSCNQNLMREMGNTAANRNGDNLNEVMEKYSNQLLEIFTRKPRYQSNINIHMHIMGYFKDELSSSEKKYFLDNLDMYRDKKIPLSTVNSILYSWVLRFDNQYLVKQSFFNPFPKELIENNKSRLFN